ncbi:hypothetical protein AB0B28_08640 [Glycomyces sp. NPDC046736]|uniref:hypothetical protein n=1 Tax=Glycomyces sp. NPDC046736 TaxID=3155615 RepID=UPI0033E067D3
MTVQSASPRPKSRTALRALMVAILSALVMGGALSLAPSAAQADGATAYLGWWEPASGPCAGNQWTPAGVVSVNPDQRNSGFFFKKTTHSQFFKTDHYIKNGVTKAQRYHVCENGYFRGYYYSPMEYVHKWQYVEWNCHSGACRPLGSWETGWNAGVQF